MKDPKEIAIEALIGATAVAVASGLLLFLLALSGVNPDEALPIIRKSPGEDRALLLALLLACSLFFGGLWRIWRARRERKKATPPPPAAPTALAPEPRTSNGHVEVGDFIPEIALIDHAGALWITTMPYLPLEAMGRNYSPAPDEISVRQPPVCPRCRTDLGTRQIANAKLEEVVSGGGHEMFCISCGWTHPIRDPFPKLKKEAEAKARGALRRMK